MMFTEAQQELQQFLAPLTLDEFLDGVLHGGWRKIDSGRGSARTGLLGADPESVLLAAVHLAPKLTFHSANPAGPPPELSGIAGPADFQQRLRVFHERNYSVRFPELRPLSAPLDRLARSLEMLLQQPVTAAASWSHGGMRGPVYYEDHDVLVVQLRGTKRWQVSSEPSQLPNTWKAIAPIAPALGPHQSLQMGPGDVLYLPRGTWHSVDSDDKSLHLSIGFSPLTLRDALTAALDHFSDLDRNWRSTVGSRLGFQLRSSGLERLLPQAAEAAAQLANACRTPGFLASALLWRSSRTIAALAPLRTVAVPELDLDTQLRHSELAFCHLIASPERIAISYPGGHLYVHRGAQPCIEFIVNAARFRVRDIPGEVSDEVRLSLAGQFVKIGFLELTASGSGV
jgi:bifunctional lysine-specific demethylase and histidyl-hydroxylase MINA